MTISATTHPSATPPYNEVTVSSGVGSVMSSVQVWRNDHNGRSLLRTQPVPGFDSRTVVDYECPYEESVTYDWESQYTTGFSTLFDETWASAAAWTVSSGSVNVSGGKVRNTATGASAAYRDFTAGRVRLTVASMSVVAGGETVGVYLGPFGVGVALLTSGVVHVVIGASTYPTTIDPSQPITIDVLESSVKVSGTGGSYTYMLTLDPSRVTLNFNGAVAANNVRIGAVKVEAYGSLTSVAETSAAVSLSPADAWLIHPASPSLSVPMSYTDPLAMGIRSVGNVENSSNATVHRILGSRLPIVTTTGPRNGDSSSLVIATLTNDERADLRSLLYDDLPILVQLLPSRNADFNCGYYQVGDVTERRDWEWVADGLRHRYFDLPIAKVQSPVTDVAGGGWSYASVVVEFTTYAELVPVFATYADLASNSRS